MASYTVLFLLMSAFVGTCICIPSLGKSSSLGGISFLGRINRELRLRKATEEIQERKSERGSDEPLECFYCKNPINTSSCLATVQTCVKGEVCATIWHTGGMNFDGCMLKTLCDVLSTSDLDHVRCCETSMCNTLGSL